MDDEPTVKESVYISAVKGRAEFRAAYQNAMKENIRLNSILTKIDSEKETGGNEFNAVMIMKERISQLESELVRSNDYQVKVDNRSKLLESCLEKAEAGLSGLDGYIESIAEEWIEPREDEDCDYALALQTAAFIKQTFAEIQAIKNGD